MEMLDSSDESLRKAGAALAAGKLVAIPTETVYGLGADAFNAIAVARVFEAKARPAFDPLIVHIANLADIDMVALSFPPKARLLAEALWPGPLTMILPKRNEVPDIVTSGLDTVAVRFPSHNLAQKIIAYSGTVIAAPSANPFGYISPTTAAHVARTLGDRIDFIVDGGPCTVGVESTVIDMTSDTPVLLRPGGMPLERIRDIVGEVVLSTKKGGVIVSPGQLKSHYAPHAKLSLYDWKSLPDSIAASDLATASDRSAAIVFDAERAVALASTGRFQRICVLSEKGDMVEAAARLFALLHELDNLGFDTIHAERVPEEGLGRAVNDRLSRAAKN
ncbi:MAG: threonylcarbamoyl-AMP synthase [Spirochaetae bacterium HGW-Spirochaetae-9]|nr:MAG: threonylcarbamoyl-AMP synthase [Spirochaetae bacterium HGW-Spirochaetae-9]